MSKGLIGLTSSRFGRPSFSMWSFSRAMFWLGGRSTHCIGRIKQDLLLFCVWREIENPGHQPYLSFCRRHGGSCSSYHRVHLDRSPHKTAELTKSQKVLWTSAPGPKLQRTAFTFRHRILVGFLTNSLNSKSENFPPITSHVTADAPKNAPAAKMA